MWYVEFLKVGAYCIRPCF